MTNGSINTNIALLDAIALEPKLLRAALQFQGALQVDGELQNAIMARMRVDTLWFLIHKAPLAKKLESVQILLDHYLAREDYETCAILHAVGQMLEKCDASWRSLAEFCEQHQRKEDNQRTSHAA